MRVHWPRILLVGCGFSLWSCGDSTGPDLEPFEGFYVLVSMDGATVPALLATDEDDGTEVFLERGSIEVLSGSSVYRTLRFVDIRPSPSGDVILNTDLEYEGLVTRSRDTLFITYPAYNIDRTDTAFVERDEVTVTLGPIAGSPRRMLRFVRDDEGIYQRRRPALPPTPQ